MRKKVIISAFLALGVGCLAVLAVGAQSGDPADAMPKESDLPGFAEYVLTRSEEETYISARRRLDGLYLSVTVVSTANAAAAQQLSQRLVRWSSSLGPLPPGCPSGRKIGDAVWQSSYPGGGPPRGGFTLTALAGRSIVRVQITLPVTEMEEGRPVDPEFAAEDLRFAEDQALAAIARLDRMGLAR